MIDQRRSRLLLPSLATVLMSLFSLAAVACGGGDEPAETPTPAGTPTATETPTATATPTSTPTPSAIDEKVISECAAVCGGGTVPLAALYEGDGPHPLVILAADGSEHEWTNDVPREWWPGTVEDVQLVVLIGQEEAVVIEVCPYIPPPDITRYRYQRSIQIIEASTGAMLDSAVLVGADPRECRQTEPLSLTRLDGESVSYARVEEWLRPFVMGSAP